MFHAQSVFNEEEAYDVLGLEDLSFLLQKEEDLSFLAGELVDAIIAIVEEQEPIKIEANLDKEQ